MSYIEPERKKRNDQFGKEMEQVACDYLKLKGYTILERNYENLLGEIDIIARDEKNKRLVFVEVKARKTAKYGFGRDAVNEQKLFKINQVASFYLRKKKIFNQPIRIDVIDITHGEINHLIAVQ